MATASEPGTEALHRLRSADPPLWLAPSAGLSEVARIASRHLFSSLKPHSSKSPFDQLLIDGFDAEQIWQQIDLQSQPLLSSLRREMKKFEKNPEEIGKLRDSVIKKGNEGLDDDDNDVFMNMDGIDDDDDKGVDDDDDSDDDDDGEGKEIERGGDASEEDEDKEEDKEEEEGGGEGIEDKFLKIKELQEYLEEGDAKEFGLENKNKKKAKSLKFDDDEEEDENEEDDEEEEEEDDEDDEDEEIGAFGDEAENEDSGQLESARYKDFFGAKKKGSERKAKDPSEEEKEEDDAEEVGSHGEAGLSTHEKELQKLQAKIEEMEKANLDPKQWTMQGEVTAARRPKNSALEVDIDFEDNVRPAPVITEEVTTSLEDMIKNRILETHFDDVGRAPSLPTKAPRETKELDDSKSMKGLAEVYEEEYVQNANPAFTQTTFADELKKVASTLFKRLCLKLDALSHFHFSPKPVVEDMLVQTNVPALAMEEIAPVAVSDAAMLAPEEIFAGKGDIKEEAELTKEERKRRRADKKRKFKAEAAKRTVKKARDITGANQNNGKEEQ